MSLTTLPTGSRGRLHGAELTCEDCDLLNALGLTERCELKICKHGNPCIVQVKSTRIGLSPAVARHIFVIPTPAQQATS
ncbi:MAG: FeoA family protein [Phycisphaerales bacterium]